MRELCDVSADFTEKMRALGYPRLISTEDFRTPNFDLVADIMYWFVQRCGHCATDPRKPSQHPATPGRYEPGYDIPNSIGSELERVNFVKAVATLFVRPPFATARVHPKLQTEWESICMRSSPRPESS